MAETMTCRELNDLVPDYLGAELAPEARSTIEGHLLKCPACVAYVRSYKETIRLVRDSADALDQQLLPTNAPEKLVEDILDATIGRDRTTPRRS